MAAKVCLLTPKEAHDLEFYGVEPNCRLHSHKSVSFATSAVESGTAYQLKPKKNRVRIAFSQARSWQKVTGRHLGEKLGIASMQMVASRVSQSESGRRKVTSQLRRIAKGRVLFESGRPVEATV